MSTTAGVSKDPDQRLRRWCQAVTFVGLGLCGGAARPSEPAVQLGGLSSDPHSRPEPGARPAVYRFVVEIGARELEQRASRSDAKLQLRVWQGPTRRWM